MNRVCTICARGGSKGVLNKNTMIIGGKPLIAHSILQAVQTGLFDAVVVSSDSAEILAVAEEYGAVRIQRPTELATDTAAKLPAIIHCLRAYEKMYGCQNDMIVDLDATSPLRHLDDIIACSALIENGEAENVITASPARRSPYFNMVELAADGRPRLVKPLKNIITRRQDSPVCYDMNASIYAWSRNALLKEKSIFGVKTRMVVMPEERSVDIDSPLDFKIVSMLLDERLRLLT